MNLTNSEYEGGAFHPELPNGKAGGSVVIDTAMISFKSHNISFQLPLDEIEVKLGGAADRLVFFSHPAYPDQTIYSRDVNILNAPQFKSQPVVRRQRKTIQRYRLKKRFGLFAACALVIAVFGSAYLLKDPFVGLVANRLPPELEDTLGKNIISQYRADHIFVESGEVDQQLNHLIEPLITAIASDRYDFKFYIVKDPSLNAFALPGGHIVIHTGLIVNASRAEEILGVLAHEIAHVNRQHGVRKVLESTGLFVILSSLFGDVGGVTAVVLSNGTFLLQQQFSRDFEREADKLAVDYLADADIDPSGLYDFFAKLKQEGSETTLGSLTDSLSLLSTHPATSERMKLLQKAIDEKSDRTHKSISFDLEAFQKLLYESKTTDD